MKTVLHVKPPIQQQQTRVLFGPVTQSQFSEMFFMHIVVVENVSRLWTSGAKRALPTSVTLLFQ